jgi:hypothetical protein
VIYEQGDAGRATALYEESLTLRRALGDIHGMAECCGGLAEVAEVQQHLDRAAQLLGMADALRASTGAPLSHRQQVRVTRQASTVRTGLGDAAFEAAWAAGQIAALEHMDAANTAQEGTSRVRRRAKKK